MKKLAILLLVALLLPLVACADSLMSITDLRAQVEASGGRWTQTYTTSNGETIPIDIRIEVPNVERFPILKANWMPQMTDEFVAEYVANGEDREEPRWYASVDRYAFVTLRHDWDFALGKGEAGSGKKFTWTSEAVFANDIDWDEAYAYNNDLPAGEAFDFIKSVIQESYEKYGLPYYQPSLYYLSLENLLYRDEPIREKGYYNFICHQAINGIPIFLCVGDGGYTVQPSYQLEIVSPDSYQFICRLYQESELVLPDVPLLPFDTIKNILDQMIIKENLQEVYMLRLGYISVYEDGKSGNESYQLIPCWVVTGEYYSNEKERAKGERLKIEEAELSIMSRGTTKNIAINAQTGEIIPQDAKQKEYKKLLNVKTW